MQTPRRRPESRGEEASPWQVLRMGQTEGSLADSSDPGGEIREWEKMQSDQVYSFAMRTVGPLGHQGIREDRHWVV